MNPKASPAVQPNMKPAASAPPPPVTNPLFVPGLILALVCAAASAMLVWHHFQNIALPGCGPGSACDAAANSKWGKIPLGKLDWPVSFIGAAYFAGVLIAWALAGGVVGRFFQNLIRLGVLASLAFVAIILIEKHYCVYCLTVHAANILFLIIVEKSPRRPTACSGPPPIFVAIGIFLLATTGLLAAEHQRRGAFNAAQNEKLAEDILRITGKTEDAGRQSGQTTVAPVQPDTAAAQPTGGDSTSKPVEVSGPRPPWGDMPFTGRWRKGPEKAAVRIVMYTDYQCPDCKRVEADLRTSFAKWQDVSWSIKYFPMDASCNRYISRTLHGNACWAARAADAAGILGGQDAFWKMHDWLFDSNGAFTDETLNPALEMLGFDPSQFLPVMTGPETLSHVQSDVEEAQWLGLHFTPMVFINGVELTGVFAPGAVSRAVEQLIGHALPSLGPEVDQPQPAMGKCVSDWREQAVTTFPQEKFEHAAGPADAKVQIVMWGDYQEEFTAIADRIIRGWMRGRNDARYEYRHFPFDQTCNSIATRTQFPQACLAARAAEAAALMNGDEGYWRMHDWLMSHQKGLTEDIVKAACPGLNLNPDKLMAASQRPEPAEAINEDCTIGQAMLYRGGIPTIYVNGRVIPRWRREKDPVLTTILNEAATGQPAAGVNSIGH